MKMLLGLTEQLKNAVSHSEAVKQLQREYTAKPMIRYGLWAMAATLLLYIALVISDEADEINANLQQLNARLARIERVQSESFWIERLAQEENNIVSVTKSIREANTKSLAKAQLQASFTSFASDELQQSRVTVSDPLFYGHYYGRDLYTVNVEVRGRMKKGASLSVIDHLAKSPYLEEVERFDIEFQQNRQLVIIVKSYFFILE